MSIHDLFTISARRERKAQLGDELYAILDEYRGQAITPALRAAIEARITGECLRFANENGFDTRLANVFVLQSTRNPSEMLVADEENARAAIRSGRWVDPLDRFGEDTRMTTSISSIVTTHPIHNHDCAACVWLGSVAKERPAEEHHGIEAARLAAFDLYYCTQHGLPTVIARYGSNGPAYTSGMALADADPILGEARSRAIAQGLCTPHVPPGGDGNA